MTSGLGSGRPSFDDAEEDRAWEFPVSTSPWDDESINWDLPLGVDYELTSSHSTPSFLPQPNLFSPHTFTSPRHQQFYASHSTTYPSLMGQASSQIQTQQDRTHHADAWQYQDQSYTSTQSIVPPIRSSGDDWQRFSADYDHARLPGTHSTSSATHLANSSRPGVWHRQRDSSGTRSQAEGNTIPQNIIDELLQEVEAREADMADRRRAPDTNDDAVDLTDNASSPSMGISSPYTASARRRQSALTGANTEPYRSRKRRHNEVDAPSPDRDHEVTEVEHLDLTTDTAAADASVAQAIASQEAAARREATAPQRIGKRHCIICLEAYTNATTTHCGHMYCHECLMQALAAGAKASDRGVSSCPMCRKPVKRKVKHQVVPIAFMKRSAFRGKGRRAE